MADRLAAPHGRVAHMPSNVAQISSQKTFYGTQNSHLKSAAQNSSLMKHSAVAQPPFKEYKWFNSDSIQQEFYCGVCRLELPVHTDINSSVAPHDLWITAQIICHGIPVQEGIMRTSFAYSDAKTNAFVWNTLLNFQVKIKDLSVDATIIFTASDPSTGEEEVYGVTTLSLFDQNGKLKTGHQKLLFYPTDEVTEHSSQHSSSSTAGKKGLSHNTSLNPYDSQNNAAYLMSHAIGEKYALYSDNDQAFIMEKHLQEFDRKSSNYESYLSGTDDDRCNWLDSLSKMRIENIFDETSFRDMLGSGLGGLNGGKGGNNRHLFTSKPKNNPLICSPDERVLTSLFCLIIELPFNPHPILFREKLYIGVTNHSPPSTLAQMMPPGCGVVVAKEERGSNYINDSASEVIRDESNLPATILEFSLAGGPGSVGGLPLGGSAAFTGASLCVTADWDMDQENLSEQQYRCLAHDLLRGKLDPSIKPNLEDKGKIDKILNAAGTHMLYEEKDLLYRYRFFLTENKKALIKFLLSVDWSVETEVAEVPLLLAQWKRKAPIDISDALRLLGKEKAFRSLIVRQYAVETLKSASDEELLAFLLQLVQALRYEPPVGVINENSGGDTVSHSTLRLQDESSYNIASSFSSSFAWTRLGMSTSGILGPSSGILGPSSSNMSDKRTAGSTIIGHHGAGVVSPLAQFLINRACESPIVANFLYWYLKVETEDEDPSGLLFRQIFDSFLIQLASSPVSRNISSDAYDHKDMRENKEMSDNKGNKDNEIFQGAECALQLYALNEYITRIFECHTIARSIAGRKDVKQAALKRLLVERGLENIPCRIEGVPMPLNPRLQIISLDPLSASMFASAVYPCVIQFNCVENVQYGGANSSRHESENYDNDRNVSCVSTVGASSTVHSSGNTKDGTDRRKEVSKGFKDEGNDGMGRRKQGENETEIKNEGEKGGVEEGEGREWGGGEGGEGHWVVDEFDEVQAYSTKNAPQSHLNVSKRKIVTVKLMFKSGDDLRQDQLVMQMMTLMDSLLRKVNLNLQLLTYGILAIGQTDGIMEFVSEAFAISAILKEHKSISKFLRIHNPSAYGPYGTSGEAIDTFVKSCAASCVVSYLLGVGDRHLDNIMMKTNGQIFHIDYGYSFFQDPKPVQPPPFRFTHHMVDAMGGEESEYYESFKSYCCQAFNWLRKSANLILNLLSLMGDAGITDISKRSDLPKVLAKVEERFRLDLSDELAESFFIGLINESLNAIAPRLLEYAHQIAVSVR